jgi:hypothetical protein
LFAVAAATAVVPHVVELDYGTQMNNLSSEGTWPNSLKQNKYINNLVPNMTT